MDYTIRIGGAAGQGLQTIGGLLTKLFSRSGYHVFTHQDYMSRIRGGHNYYQIRFANKEIMSSREKVDILIALDANTIDVHKESLNDYGIIAYDSGHIKKSFDSNEFLDIPFDEIAMKDGGDIITSNTVAVGAVLGMLGMELSLFEEIISEILYKKGEDVINSNRNAAKAGYSYAVNECTECRFTVSSEKRESLMLINSSQAVGLGSLVSGCKFYSAYPMTPSTGIMIYLASKAKEYGLVVEQAEDEISAINMALGASFGGVRAMTGSSGGGFALMVEGVSLAEITELPIVIAEVQRPGPATGLPTRTEQGDLLFVLFTGHGEFPRVVFAPGSPEQAVYLTNRAFEISEKYQIPVFIMSDQYLADSEWTFRGLDINRLVYNDYRLRETELKAQSSYKRYAYTETGVSPLAVPGVSKHLVVVDSDEHDEEGHIVEEADIRINMVEKRLSKKLPLIRKEMEPPLFYGKENPEVVLVGWGSTYGVIKDAVDHLSDSHNLAMLHFSDLYPFPLTDKFDFMKVLKEAKFTISIENNASGQFAYFMKAETGYDFHASIHKNDGRPFILEGLIGEINGYITRV